MEFTPAVATTVAALVGGLVGLVSSRLQISQELKRWPRQREDALAAELRRAIQEYATTIAGAAHAMCWFTWAATQGREFLGEKQVGSYNAEIHAVLPRIAGSLASIAALDGRAYEDLAPVAEELYDLDAKAGELALLFSYDPEAATLELAKLHGRVAPFERSVPRRIAGIVGKTIEERARALSRQ
jgi:hypothetical protein